MRSILKTMSMCLLSLTLAIPATLTTTTAARAGCSGPACINDGSGPAIFGSTSGGSSYGSGSRGTYRGGSDSRRPSYGFDQWRGRDTGSGYQRPPRNWQPNPGYQRPQRTWQPAPRYWRPSGHHNRFGSIIGGFAAGALVATAIISAQRPQTDVQQSDPKDYYPPAPVPVQQQQAQARPIVDPCESRHGDWVGRKMPNGSVVHTCLDHVTHKQVYGIEQLYDAAPAQ